MDLKNDEVKRIVSLAQLGDSEAREHLIDDHRFFIRKIVSKYVTGCEEIHSRDEYSIGLMAFNESIDNYKPGLRSFHSFAAEVIKKRLIDYYRSQKKHKQNTVFLADAQLPAVEGDTSFPNHQLQVKQEMGQLVRQLSEYGITLRDLVNETPKHSDSQLLCIKLARAIAEDHILSEHLLKYRTIPLTMLLKKISINPKTVGRNRKYIISLCLVILGDLEIIKGYIARLSEGGGHHDQ